MKSRNVSYLSGNESGEANLYGSVANELPLVIAGAIAIIVVAGVARP